MVGHKARPPAADAAVLGHDGHAALGAGAHAHAQANAVGYLSKAFELSRQFEYKWTVNLRMIPAATFASSAEGLRAVDVALRLWRGNTRLGSPLGPLTAILDCSIRLI